MVVSSKEPAGEARTSASGFSTGSPCRCAQLEEAFPSAAPDECGPCNVRRRREELRNKGFVKVQNDWRRALQECGIEYECVEHDTWMPGWAYEIEQATTGSGLCRPILLRAVADETFRASCLSIIDLVRFGPFQDEPSPKERLLAYALAQGVTAMPH